MSPLPVILSFLFGAAATVGSLWLGTYTYTYATDVDPYRDTGFLAAPDWSSYTHPNYIYAGVHAALLVLFCAFSSLRLTIFRRLFFLWGLAQVIQMLQTLSTRFPDPNVNLRNRDWDYTMYEVQYVLGALFVQFYSARTWLRFLSWVVSIVGLMLLIPTHALYTVDMLCGVFAALGPFLIYHWYVRTTTSITNRRCLRWFESDATDGRVLFEAAGATTSGTLAAASESTFLYQNIDDPSRDYHLEHFRHPTLEVGERITHMEALIDEAEALPEKWKLFYPIFSSGVVCAFGGGMAFMNLIGMHAADEQRPIGIPLPDDFIYNILPQVPDHTADVLLYIQVVSVLLFTLASKWRFTILRRTALAYGIIMACRCLTVPATFPPDPSPVCAHRQHPEGTTCGDLIFSGHTVAFLMSAFVVSKYTKPNWLEAGTWAFTTCGLLAVVTSRLHYTRDVVTAILVIVTVFHLLDQSIYQRPDRVLHNKLIRYIELDHYIVLAEDRAAEREGRLARHNLIGRFWQWARGTAGPQIPSSPGNNSSLVTVKEEEDD